MAGSNYYSSIRNQAQIKTTTLGSSNISGIQTAFPNSPIHNGELNYNERLEVFQKLVMDGVPRNADGSTSLGNGFQADVNRDYHLNDSPDIHALAADPVKLEALRLVSPYFPNLTSPGPGSFDATQAPLYGGNVKNIDDIDQWGTGFKGTYNPLKSANCIADTLVEKINLSKGTSFQ